MSIEERVYDDLQFWGEQTELPAVFPPSFFGSDPQWSSIEEIVLADVEETSPIYPQRRPQFFEDLEVEYL
jgi:hypothetical protein